MSKYDPILANFNAGEFSPLLHGRVDIEKYRSGCAELQNFLIMPYGGVNRRPGTKYVAEVKTSAKATRLIPFQFSTTQAYIIELGDLYMRFYKDNGQISVDAGDLSDFDPTAAYDTAGDFVKIGDYIELDCGADKLLHVSAPYGESTAGKTVAVTIAAGDALAVNYAAGAISIELANTTPAKNSADLIQAALRLADASTDDWYVTENATYAAARPTAGVNLGATALTAGDEIHFCIQAVTGNATNTSVFPTNTVDTGYWTEQDIYEIATTYAEADLFEIQYCQSADTMYLVHPDYEPSKLTRSGHTAWELSAIDYSANPNRPALMDDNTSATTITPSADAGAGITLTASTSIFDADHVGSIWRIKSGYAEIVGFTSGTVVTANVLYSGNLATGPAATTDWAEGAWSDYRGYPSCINFYEQRLFFAATTDQPQAAWGSVTAEYENMETGADASDALSYTIASGQVNAIKWMIGGRGLALGTSGGIFVMSSGGSSEALTPDNVKVDLDTTYGAADILPKKIGNFVYYVQRNDRTMREFSYSWDIDSFVSLDMTLLAEHITESGVVEMDYQQSPYNMLWCVRSDGTIATLTRQIDQQVIGWARQVTDGDFESVAIIPNGEEDQVWFVVNRNIDGSDVRYVEYMMPIEFGDYQEDCYFVDSGLSYDAPVVISGITKANPGVVTTATAHGFSNGNTVKIRKVVGMTEVNEVEFTVANAAANTFELSGVNTSAYTAYVSGGEVRKCTTSISGLSHLEGEEVQVLADGASHPDETVASGAITLDLSSDIVHVGLGYTPAVKTLRAEGGSAQGTAQGKKKRIAKVMIRLYRSLGVKIGSDELNDDIYFRDSSMSMDEPVDLFTGDKDIHFPIGWETTGQIYITSEQPLPMTIICLAPRLDVSDY